MKADKGIIMCYISSARYADNETNTNVESSIDIDWAVNNKGQKVNLPGVDFVKIYTGVNQENGWLGECSTEITERGGLTRFGRENRNSEIIYK